MKLGDESRLFAKVRSVDHQICAHFENLFHGQAKEAEIFAFIQQQARFHFDALIAAQQKNQTLAYYCNHPAMREFWKTLLQEAEDSENSATVNI